MSFFDEDDDPAGREPAARPARPRSGGRPPRQGSSAADRQTLLIRRAVAGVGLILFLLLAAVALRGCLAAQHEDSLQNYNSELGSIVRESDQQVGRPFFRLLNEGGGSAQRLQTTISGFRVTAEQQLQQAEDMDVPDDMAAAHESALVALEFRASGLAGIAERIRPALGDQGEQADQAVAGIAGQMQSFLASDVTWQGRVAPLIKSVLDEEEIGGQRIANTDRFLEDLAWLDEQTVASRLGAQGDGGGGGTTNEEPAPGLHGTGLVSVTGGGVTLQPGAANRLPAATTDFTVTFANQGENDEFDVRVELRIEPTEGAGDPIVARETVDEVAQGAQAEVTLALDQPPPPGEAVTVTVEVQPVPGERTTDNNSQEYTALFEG